MGQMAMQLCTFNTVNTCFVERRVFLGPLKGQPEIETEGGFEDNTKEIGKVKLWGDKYLPFSEANWNFTGRKYGLGRGQ